MLTENQLKKLRIEWTKRINNQSGIIYKYVQKELVESFIDDLCERK